MSKFPDFDGIWEFPNDQNSVPKTGWKSQELGKFPISANTGQNLQCLHVEGDKNEGFGRKETGAKEN